MIGRFVRPAMAGALALFSCAAVGQGSALAALNQLQSGTWQFHEIGSTGAFRDLCVSDPKALLQIRHAGAQCSRFVIDESGRSATVHYTCPGRGHGRTTITVENARLIRLQTQGIASGAPFDMDYEGRRTGSCEAGRLLTFQ